MKYLKLTPFLLFLGIASAIYANHDVTPTIIARSQGRNGALKVAGLAEKVHLYDEGCYYNVDATLMYSRSFRDHHLAQCLFGNDLVNCNSILIQGSGVANRDPQAWLADYFYLPPDYNASFSIEPRIQNIVVNLDFFVGLDEWVRGLYLRVHGPLTWSKWSLNFNEACDIETTGSYGPGVFNHSGLSNDQLLHTFGEYASGAAPLATSGVTINGTQHPEFGTQFEGLNYAKMERCSRARTGFAEVRFELGCDFLQADNYHLGLNVQVVAPSGSRRDAEFVFDPTIGNGNHWEVGAGVTAHYVFWRSESEDRFGGFYLDASITHVNNAREQRTFDLCNKPNSRYMLAEKLGTVSFLRAGATAGSTVIPTAQFKGIFTPVANLTTLDVNIRSTIQADIAAMFNFTTSNWGFDVGYNFWGRSCEKISLRDRPTSECCPSLCTDEVNTWALKGDARVFGFVSASSSPFTQNDPIPLSATQCGANIHQGTNVTASVADCTGVDALQNCGVDNAQFAWVRGTADTALVHSPGLTAASDQIKTSLNPKFINCCDINLQRTRGISHTVFANLNYTWDRNTWKPYFGLGGSVEFGSHESNDDGCCVEAAPTPADCTTCDLTTCCDTECSCCLDCAVSKWAIWLKGGVHF